jgi:hypothetical protein
MSDGFVRKYRSEFGVCRVQQNQEETRKLVDFYDLEKHEIVCTGD